MVRTPDSDIYDKWAQSISSAEELAMAGDTYAQDTGVAICLVAILPVVVIPDNLLWVAAYEDNGSISSDPSKKEHCELFVGRELGIGKIQTPCFHRFVFSHVHFFTLSGFRSFLSSMAVNGPTWDQLFTNKAEEAPI